MGLIRNKRGVIFTVLAIVIAVFFSLIFSAQIEKPIDHKTIIIETRVNVLNSYLTNFFDFAQEAGAITGYSALQGVIEDLNNMRAYNPDFEAQYHRCIEKGNLTSSKVCPGMSDKTLTYYLDRMQTLALDKLNIKSQYTIHNITTTQSVGPFSIEVSINLSLNITDDYANLSDTRIVTSSISIEGLLDPLYLINGSYNQTINRTTIKKKAGEIGGIWNHSDLQQLFYNHEYRNHYAGINFIKRIKGNLTYNASDMFGIESFVNHTGPGVSYGSKHTMVDYLFWQNVTLNCTNPVQIVEIDSTIISPPGFQLDVEHWYEFNNMSLSNSSLTC